MTSPSPQISDFLSQLSDRATFARRAADEVLRDSPVQEHLAASTAPHERFKALSPAALRSEAYEMRTKAAVATEGATRIWTNLSGGGAPLPSLREANQGRWAAMSEHHAWETVGHRIGGYYRDIKPHWALTPFGGVGRVVWSRWALRKLDAVQQKAREEFVERVAPRKGGTDEVRAALGAQVDAAFEDAREETERCGALGGLRGFFFSAGRLRHVLGFDASVASMVGSVAEPTENAEMQEWLYEALERNLRVAEEGPAVARELETRAGDIDARFSAFLQSPEGRSVREAFGGGPAAADTEVTERLIAAATGVELDDALKMTQAVVEAEHGPEQQVRAVLDFSCFDL